MKKGKVFFPFSERWYRMKVEELKPIINEILKYYFNRNTRILYDSKIQNEMINQNNGLINACCAVIGLCDDIDALEEYTKSKIEEINKVAAAKGWNVSREINA
jgi:hypothetical protein